jgi:cytochrome c oxidase assembly protein subunit 11
VSDLLLNSADQQARKNKKFLFSLLLLFSGMVMLTFASVPLYQIFCKVTGYGGTTQTAILPSTVVLDREINIRFNSDVDPNLPWAFKPQQLELKLHIGETGVAYYKVQNLTNEPLVGIATYNVTPLKAGKYFNKIECFCFTDQYIAPGETKNMPVTFFISPDLDRDRHMKEIETITLSYTFFSSKADPKDVIGLHREGIGDQLNLGKRES